MELTTYLADKAMTHFSRQSGRRFVVAWGRDLQSNQEEADTKIILHAGDATSDGAMEIQVHSPDTDVFVLALRRYPELCADASLSPEKGATAEKSRYKQ